MQYMREYGPKLVANGYPIVPIKRGEKRPLVSDWTNLTLADAEQIIDKYPSAGVGVLAEHVAAIDIDITDSEKVDAIVKYLTEVFKVDALPIRIGKAPKVLIPVRTEKPIHKMVSHSFTNPEDNQACRVEILGSGQQWVAYADYPKSDHAYQWINELQPTNLKYDQLPLLTERIAKALVKYVDLLLENWRDDDATTVVEEFDDENIVVGSKGIVEDVSTDQLRKELLPKIAPLADDYETWVNVGMGLWYQYTGSTEGFELWNEWSQHSGKYNPGEMVSKWQSFKPQKGQRPTTLLYVLKLTGQPKSVLNWMLENLIHVAEGNRVYNLSKPKHCATLKAAEASAEFKNKLIKIKKTYKSAYGLWGISKDRLQAQAIVYEPGQPHLFQRDAMLYINEFDMPHHTYSGNTHLLGPWLEHFHYLLPNAIEAEWFLDFLAFTIQRPELRCNVAPLIVSRPHGTGRGLIIRMLEKLIGFQNVTTATMHKMINSEFQEYLYKTKMCFIEEVRETGKERYAANDKLRAIIDSPNTMVNLKYEPAKYVPVFTNIVMFTNHGDALVLTKEDRRFNVFSGPEVAESEEYFENWHNNILPNREAVAQFYHYLMSRDLSGFNYQRRMDTPAFEAMVAATTSDLHAALQDLIKDPPFKIMTSEMIQDYLLSSCALEDIRISSITAALRDLNIERKQIKIKNGSRPRVWVLTREQLTSKELKAESAKWELADLLY